MEFGHFFSQLFNLVWYSAPIWLPLVTGFVAWELWLQYIRTKFDKSNPKILLEVRLPQEILKSPLAMELVLTSLNITSRESTFIDRYIKGKSRPQFSFELASFGGQVHFFIWTEAGYKNLIEAQIYAQYPGVEVGEIVDYTRGVKYDPVVNSMWGVEFIKSFADVKPIKTYVDYGMDKDPKEEFKIDPMTPTLEFLGSLKEGQQAWLQIILRAHKKELRRKDKKTGRYTKVDWSYDAKEERDNIIKGLKDPENKEAPARRMTKGEEQIVSAIERNVSKLAFDVGIRGIYLASTETFNGIHVAGMNGVIRQYNAQNLNVFKLQNPTSFDYPWEDYKNSRLNSKKASMLRAYKRRKYFKMRKRQTFVMSTEEIATMYHFPGQVASTPTFARIMSKKSEAPANLPF